MKKAYITTDEIPQLFSSITRGEFFSITFRKKDGSLRVATAQRGVRNPAGIPRPNGTGESATAALAAGRLKFYDISVINANGTHGAYRQARFSAILDICYKQTLFIIDHTGQ